MVGLANCAVATKAINVKIDKKNWCHKPSGKKITLIAEIAARNAQKI